MQIFQKKNQVGKEYDDREREREITDKQICGQYWLYVAINFACVFAGDERGGNQVVVIVICICGHFNNQGDIELRKRRVMYIIIDRYVDRQKDRQIDRQIGRQMIERERERKRERAEVKGTKEIRG